MSVLANATARLSMFKFYLQAAEEKELTITYATTEYAWDVYSFNFHKERCQLL